MSQNPNFPNGGGQQGGANQNAIEQHMRQMAWQRVQEKLDTFFTQTRQRIEAKRENEWPSPEEAREQAAKIENQGNADQAIESSTQDFMQHMVRLMLTIIEAEQAQDAGFDALREVGQDLLVELHNPSTKEAILLGVNEEYRDHYRGMFDDLGANLWGMVDLSQGNMTRDMWTFMDTLAASNGLTLEEYAQHHPQVTPEQVPDDLRDS